MDFHSNRIAVSLLILFQAIEEVSSARFDAVQVKRDRISFFESISIGSNFFAVSPSFRRRGVKGHAP
jgi:hypothetical protein